MIDNHRVVPLGGLRHFMADIRESLRLILKNNSHAEAISDRFEYGLVNRLRTLLYSFEGHIDIARTAKLNTIVEFVVSLYPVLGGLIGFVTTIYYSNWPSSALYTIWGVYIATAIVLILVNQLLPRGVEQFNDRIEAVKLTNLSERLAAKTALFDLLPESETDDDEAFISTISQCVPEAGELSKNDKQIISTCIDPKSTFDTSRGTNINVPRLVLSSVQQQKLEDITRQLVTLAEFMFGENSITAKLYLRACV